MAAFVDLVQAQQPTIAALREASGGLPLVGLSTATKPAAFADGTALPAGSTYRELDTGFSYYWTGSAWVLRADAQAGDLATVRQAAEAAPTRYQLSILRELRLIATLLAQAQGIPAASLPPPPADLQPLAIG